MRPAGVLLALLLAVPARALEAAAGKADVTPRLETEKVWLAGFGARGRRPSGVHDPLFARLLVLREGGKTLGVASFDLLGLSREDVLELRRLSGFTGDAKRLLVHSTHQHSGPDTLGLWGPMPGVSGVNRAWLRRALETTAAELRRLETALEPARLTAGAGKLDPRGLCRDSRDPQVIDGSVAALRATGRNGRTLATVVSWACHPEVLGRENLLLTADFPGPLCARVEEKTGGACLFLNGMIGGLLTPDVTAENFYESARVGRAVADAALALPLTASGGAVRWRSRPLLVPVENSRYLLFLPALAAGHALRDASGNPLRRGRAWTLSLRHLLFGLKPARRPWVESEVSVVDAGPARLVGVPGEAFPELALGGYDGSGAHGRPLVTPGNPDPPALEKAPKGPYLKALSRAPVTMLVGLADDELGYLVPEYDFEVRPGRFMLPRLPGHYEETNSIGPAATALVTGALAELLKESP